MPERAMSRPVVTERPDPDLPNPQRPQWQGLFREPAWPPEDLDD